MRTKPDRHRAIQIRRVRHNEWIKLPAPGYGRRGRHYSGHSSSTHITKPARPRSWAFAPASCGMTLTTEGIGSLLRDIQEAGADEIASSSRTKVSASTDRQPRTRRLRQPGDPAGDWRSISTANPSSTFSRRGRRIGGAIAAPPAGIWGMPAEFLQRRGWLWRRSAGKRHAAEGRAIMQNAGLRS